LLLLTRNPKKDFYPEEHRDEGPASFRPDKDFCPERPSEGLLSGLALGSLFSLFSLFAQRVFHNSFAIKCFRTLSENCWVYTNNSHSGTQCSPLRCLRVLSVSAFSFSGLRSSTFNVQLSTVDFRFPCATLSASFWENRMPTRDDAWKLLCEYTASESLRKHMLAVEACVRAYARKAGADEETWGLAALLHDFDYERWPNQEHSPDQGHPSEGAKILREQGYSEEIVRAILSHADYCNVPRQSALEHTLFACDELAGFLTACAYVRPSKSILDLEVDSVKRRMKDKLFAKGVSRVDVRKGAEELGIPLEEHITFCIGALREHAGALGLRGTL